MNGAQRIVLGGLLVIALFELGMSKRLGKLWKAAFSPATPPAKKPDYQGDEHQNFDNFA